MEWLAAVGTGYRRGRWRERLTVKWKAACRPTVQSSCHPTPSRLRRHVGSRGSRVAVDAPVALLRHTVLSRRPAVVLTLLAMRLGPRSSTLQAMPPRCSPPSALLGVAGSPVHVRHFAPRERCRGAPVNDPISPSIQDASGATVMSGWVVGKTAPEVATMPALLAVRLGFVGFASTRTRLGHGAPTAVTRCRACHG